MQDIYRFHIVMNATQMRSSFLKLVHRDVFQKAKDQENALVTAFALSVLAGLGAVFSYIYVLPPVALIGCSATSLVLLALAISKIFYIGIGDVDNLILEGKFDEAVRRLVILKESHKKNVDKVINKPFPLLKKNPQYKVSFNDLLCNCVFLSIVTRLNEKRLSRNEVRTMKKEITAYQIKDADKEYFRELIDRLQSAPKKLYAFTARPVKNVAEYFLWYKFTKEVSTFSICGLGDFEEYQRKFREDTSRPLSADEINEWRRVLPFLKKKDVGANAYHLVRRLSECQTTYDVFKAAKKYPLNFTEITKQRAVV